MPGAGRTFFQRVHPYLYGAGGPCAHAAHGAAHAYEILRDEAVVGWRAACACVFTKRYGVGARCCRSLPFLFVLRRRWSEDILRSGLHACGRLSPKYARVLLVANILRRVSASRRRRSASGTQDTRSQGHTRATTSNMAKRGPATAHPRAAVRSRATSLL